MWKKKTKTFCLLYIFPSALPYSLNQTGISLYDHTLQNHIALMLPFSLDADLKPEETPFIHWNFQSFKLSSALQKISHVNMCTVNSGAHFFVCRRHLHAIIFKNILCPMKAQGNPWAISSTLKIAFTDCTSNSLQRGSGGSSWQRHLLTLWKAPNSTRETWTPTSAWINDEIFQRKQVPILGT